MCTPVLLPAAFGGFRAGRPFLAIADCFEVLHGDPELRHEIARGGGPAIAEAEVVFSRAALVAVALDDDAGVGEVGEDSLQRFGIRREGGAGVGPNVVRIVIEQGVLQIAFDTGFQCSAARRSRCCGGRRRHWGCNR